MNRIGTTETGEPSYDLSWADNLYDANILITKNLSYEFRKLLMEDERYKKCIVHITCTGWGNTLFEPNVPTPEELLKNTLDLIDSGFPVKQLVLRVDPIIPSEFGLERVAHVLQLFGDNTEITRVRVSILDLYDHVKARLYELTKFMDGPDAIQYRIPWNTWWVPQNLVNETAQLLNTYYQKYRYEYETCAEPRLAARSEGQIKEIGCVSLKDLEILGCDTVTCEGTSRQRKTCLCPANKYQILKSKPGQCQNKCVYCFWKSNN